MQVVDSLAILVEQQRRRLSVAWFDPVGKKSSLVSLVPQVLIEICVSNLLKRINFVGRNQVTVKIHKRKSYLLEDSLCQQVSLYS